MTYKRNEVKNKIFFDNVRFISDELTMLLPKVLAITAETEYQQFQRNRITALLLPKKLVKNNLTKITGQ